MSTESTPAAEAVARPAPEIYHLSAPGAFTPALGASKPDTVSGQPAFYLDKDLVGVGEYRGHAPDGKASVVKSTPERIRQWVVNTKKMMAANVKVPIVCDHELLAESSKGFIWDIWVGDDGKLYGCCQFIGEDAPVIAARNQVSVGIDAKHYDGAGNYWGDVIYHVALTPDPADPNQGEFKQAASRTSGAAQRDVLMLSAATTDPIQIQELPMDDGMINCSAEHEKALRSYIPGLSDCPKEELMSRLVQHHHTMAKVRENLAGGPSMIAHMSRSQIETKADETIETWRKQAIEVVPSLQGQMAEKDKTISLLSKNAIKVLDGDAQDMALESVTIKAQRAIEKGGVSNVTRDLIMSEFGKAADGTVNQIMLSRVASNSGSVIPLARLFDILADNKPDPEPGTRSHTQLLSRPVPGHAGAQNDADLAKAIDEYASKAGGNDLVMPVAK